MIGVDRLSIPVLRNLINEEILVVKNWTKPFLELKQNLRPLFDARLGVHHAVALSTRHGDALRP